MRIERENQDLRAVYEALYGKYEDKETKRISMGEEDDDYEDIDDDDADCILD